MNSKKTVPSAAAQVAKKPSAAAKPAQKPQQKVSFFKKYNFLFQFLRVVHVAEVSRILLAEFQRPKMNQLRGGTSAKSGNVFFQLRQLSLKNFPIFF